MDIKALPMLILIWNQNSTMNDPYDNECRYLDILQLKQRVTFPVSGKLIGNIHICE